VVFAGWKYPLAKVSQYKKSFFGGVLDRETRHWRGFYPMIAAVGGLSSFYGAGLRFVKVIEEAGGR
jgi:hypothetical protein